MAGLVTIALWLALGAHGRADASEAEEAFAKGTKIFGLRGGAGASVFVAAGVALNAGYRLQHFSNANTSRPNRGYNAHTGIVGLSFFFH